MTLQQPAAVAKMRAGKTFRSCMNSTPDNHDTDDGARPRSWVRRELIVAGVALALGLFVLPGLIYFMGAALLGPYAENRGVGAFYADFFRDLGEPSGRAWALVVGPLVLVTAIRAVFIGVKPGSEAGTPTRSQAETPPKRRPEDSQRVEPRVTLD
jgi:hypothetical protein